MNTPTLKDWMFLLALGVIWGSSFMAAKVALQDLGPLWVAAARVTLAGMVLFAAMILMGRSFARGRAGLAATFSFALLSHAIPFFLLNWAQQTVTSSFAGVAMAAVPLFVLPLAIAFVPGERFGWLRLIGLVLGFLGVVVLLGPSELLSGEAAALPRMACILASLCYATGGIVTRLAPPMDQIGYSAGALLIAALVTVPGALIVEGVPQVPQATPLLALVYLALGPTAVAALILVRTIRSAGPTFLSLVNYMVPVWAVIFGAALLSEALPASFLLAAALILSGVAISQRGVRRARLAASADA